ncbi:hypothetical protein ACFVX6_16805 [Streptomyces sp. NPDC058289]|uniref:hypothetical protein n=1 Tax=Streptomyces sp. NPDC058289 TaxID=3346425 RepID=UPI0036EF79B0
MANAKMTETQLAEACGVDAKTVGRWITDPNRIPHARHRWATCEALGEEETALWPNAIRTALTSGPDKEDGIEGRFETGHVNLSVFRFDDEMIVTPILARRVGHDSPMMHLRRRQTDGMFDRFSAHVEELWSRGRDIREVGHDAQA